MALSKQQIQAIKAKQQRTVKTFRDFGVTRLPTGESVITRRTPRFNLQEEKILMTIEKKR